MRSVLFVSIVAAALLCAFAATVSQTCAGYQLEEKLDASIIVNVAWETLPRAGGNIQEQGSCLIQASGKVMKVEREKKRRTRRQSSSASEEITYLSGEEMKVTYTFKNKYFDRGVLCAEEEASGSQMVRGKDVGIGEPGFNLSVALGMAGKMKNLQLCGDARKIQENIFTVMEAPPSDNYMFSFTVPFRTTVRKHKDCPVPAGGRAFALHIAHKKVDASGMRGSYSWQGQASDFNQAVIRECGNSTQFVEPSPGRNYSVRYNVAWQFGKVKPQVKIYQVTKNKDIDITDGEVDVLAGQRIKIKAVVLPYADAGGGRWSGIPESVISGYTANDDSGKVVPFRGHEKPEIEFFFVEGKPEGKKITLRYVADKGKIAGTTSFLVFTPQVITKEMESSRDITVGPMEKTQGKAGCWLYHGKLTKASPPEGTPGILMSHEIKMPAKFSGHPHLLQHVQLVKEEILEHHDIDYFQMSNKDWCLDTYYPYGKMEPAGSPFRDPAPNRVAMNDTPAKELGFSTNEAYIRDQFETYLMFTPCAKPDDETCAWIPLKVVEWGWRAGAKRMVDWRREPPCDKKTFQVLYGSVAGPAVKESRKHPEWTCNVVNNKKVRIYDEERWKKALNEHTQKQKK